MTTTHDIFASLTQLPAPILEASATLFLWNTVTFAMLALVSLVGIVIWRFAHTYLEGEPGRGMFKLMLAITLAAVFLLATADSLLVLSVCWLVTSLTLHRMLTYYPDREASLLVAHKKFLLSRLGDLSLAAALVMIWQGAGTLSISELNDAALASGQVDELTSLGSIFIVIAVILRTAQLPFHGWLIQVMEAPTPVSALLHAGIVNVGGFVLIRLADVINLLPATQTLLVVYGTFTAVIATLIMMTRVSIKVNLAWSTCAQMGFMLLQCGLGAWHLALLHLLAHSIYKAHAFLTSGSTVERWRFYSHAPRLERLAAWPLLLSLPVSLGCALGSTWAVYRLLGFDHGVETALGFAVILGLALSPMLARGLGHQARTAGQRLLLLVGLCASVMLWHALSHWSGVPILAEPSALNWSIVLVCFTLLFALQAGMIMWPASTFTRNFQPRLYAGLYLDEIFTRLTFLVWPPRKS